MSTDGLLEAVRPQLDGSVTAQMDTETFCRKSNVVIVVGKGGVGKTTVAAALAHMAADVGLSTLIVCLEDTGQLQRLFGQNATLTDTETELYKRDPSSPRSGSISARLVTANGALVEYLQTHGFRAVARQLTDAGALDVIATAAPGVRELLILGKIKQLEQERQFDLVVLDAPATGHAITLMTSPTGLAAAARGGPLRAQAEQIVEFMANDRRCQVMLVTIPEETPVNEVIETAYALEDQMYVVLGPVVVNGCHPQLDHLTVDPFDAARQANAAPPTDDQAERLRRASRFRVARQQLQAEQHDHLVRDLPLPQLKLPYVFSAELNNADLARLAHAFSEAVEQL